MEPYKVVCPTHQIEQLARSVDALRGALQAVIDAWEHDDQAKHGLAGLIGEPGWVERARKALAQGST